MAATSQSDVAAAQVSHVSTDAGQFFAIQPTIVGVFDRVRLDYTKGPGTFQGAPSQPSYLWTKGQRPDRNLGMAGC